MAVKPVIDRGQELDTPEMRAMGIVDTREQFDEVTRALKAAGYSDSNIIALQCTDGIEMLKRLQSHLDGMASHRVASHNCSEQSTDPSR